MGLPWGLLVVKGTGDKSAKAVTRKKPRPGGGGAFTYALRVLVAQMQLFYDPPLPGVRFLLFVRFCIFYQSRLWRPIFGSVKITIRAPLTKS